jgi:hypothetical protein
VTGFEPDPAYAELLALACRMRPDWNRDDLRNAMTAAHAANMAWREVFREVARLVWAEDETPVTFRNSLRKVPDPPTGPDVYDRGAALARDLLGLDPGSAA